MLYEVITVDPDLAGTIFHFLEFSRVCRMLAQELPGLMRQIRPLLHACIAGRSKLVVAAGDNEYAEPLRELVNNIGCDVPEPMDITLLNHSKALASLQGIASLYSRFSPNARNNFV